MRVAYVCGDYPLFTGGRSGGIGTHTYNLSRAVARLGHDVTVIATADTTQRFHDDNVEVLGVPMLSRRQWKLGGAMPVNWLRWSFTAYATLRREHAKRPFDLVVFPDAYGEGFRYAFSPLAPFIVRFGGPATVIQEWDGRVLPPVRARFERWMERTPSARANLLVCASNDFASAISRQWQLDSSRFRIIRNPVDVGRFCPPSIPPKGDPVVLFAGHIQPLKGVVDLVDTVPQVAAKVPGVRFVLVGNDTRTASNRSSLRRFLEARLNATNMKDRVTFVGSLPQQQLIEWYRACSVFVLPSHHDVFPNAVLEAMACGCPCVVTSSIGVAEVVSRYDAGRVVPPRDTAALSAALVDVLALAPAARMAMGHRARHAVAAECALESVGERAESVYREAIEAAGKPHRSDVRVLPGRT